MRAWSIRDSSSSAAWVVGTTNNSGSDPITINSLNLPKNNNSSSPDATTKSSLAHTAKKNTANEVTAEYALVKIELSMKVEGI